MGKCRIMGIVNLTPDSFLEASRVDFSDLDSLVARVGRLLDAGAGIIDVGACSTAPGNEAVGAEQEWRRLKKPLAALFKFFPETVFSIDSFRPETIRKVLDLEGADAGRIIVNDVRACEMNPEMLEVVAENGLEYVAMDSSDNPSAFFEVFGVRAADYGIEKWILDPGFGFGKTVKRNWEILRGLSEFRRFARPVLAALSRKRMVYLPAGLTPDTCAAQSVEAELLAIANGADIVRTHDVEELRKFL